MYCGKYIALRAKAIGLNSIMLKIADGHVTYGSEENLAEIVAACKKYKIDVIGWQYIYGLKPKQEAEKAHSLCSRLGVTGFIVNAEEEFKRAGAEAKAIEYFAELLPNITVPVGYTTYRYPNLHQAFPWKVFIENTDFTVPQVYWVQATNPAHQLRECMRQYREWYSKFGLGNNLVMYPAGAAYSQSNWKPTAAQIVEFDEAVKAEGLTGISFWEWTSAIALGLEDTIAELDWPLPDEGGGDTEFDDLMERLGSIEEKLDILTAKIETLEEFADGFDTWIRKY
jgi:hypothetical protein